MSSIDFKKPILNWNKVTSMALIISSILLWKGFQYYMSTRTDIYIGQWVPPLLIICFIHLIGLVFPFRMDNSYIKYILILIHLAVIIWAIYAVLVLFDIGGGMMNVLEQITY